MVRLAAESWDSDQPQTVTLRNWGLDDATIRPVWQWHLVVCLDLSRNNLRELPENIHFPNLTDLDVSKNKITKLPTQLRLPCLLSLDMSHNRLRDVRAAMEQICGHSSKLTSIELKGNKKLIVPSSQIIESGSKKICQYFKDLHRGQRICWSQTVLVVGQEEAGKTALCHALSGYQCADHAQMTEESTVGIDTVPWSTVVAIPGNNRSNHRQSHGNAPLPHAFVEFLCTHGILVTALLPTALVDLYL